MVPTREQYVESLRQAAMEVAERADELFPQLEQRASVTFQIVFNPDEVPLLQVTQTIHPMKAIWALVSAKKEGDAF